ncbi:MAG: hypothetical protein P4L58_00235, partial [Candidatus Pacebacteria bacterium]|nr:hypothetical protein [Candidatus Paceibacterota bacterium]
RKPVFSASAQPRPTAAPPAKEVPLKNNNPTTNSMKVNGLSSADAGTASQANSPGAPKPMYEAVCGTCEEKIMVPFKPDPSRPTFCKECLKDYQRARARAKAEREESQGAKRETQDVKNAPSSTIRDTQSAEPVVFVSKEKPISLGQMTHIAPKKFKLVKKNIQVDLAGIKKLIDQTRENKSN